MTELDGFMCGKKGVRSFLFVPANIVLFFYPQARIPVRAPRTLVNTSLRVVPGIFYDSLK